MSMSVEEDIYEMFKDKIDAAKSQGIMLVKKKAHWKRRSLSF